MKELDNINNLSFEEMQDYLSQYIDIKSFMNDIKKENINELDFGKIEKKVKKWSIGDWVYTGLKYYVYYLLFSFILNFFSSMYLYKYDAKESVFVEKFESFVKLQIDNLFMLRNSGRMNKNIFYFQLIYLLINHKYSKNSGIVKYIYEKLKENEDYELIEKFKSYFLKYYTEDQIKSFGKKRKSKRISRKSRKSKRHPKRKSKKSKK